MDVLFMNELHFEKNNIGRELLIELKKLDIMRIKKNKIKIITNIHFNSNNVVLKAFEKLLHRMRNSGVACIILTLH